jgi:hypothetical protein
MADYGKLAAASVEWNDREMLTKMFELRVLRGFGEHPPTWKSVWDVVSVPTVDERDTLDFLLDASLMRPRYLIRLFETARRRAVTLGRDRIEEADYKAGLEELGWQVLEDFDRELTDVVPDAEELLFELATLGARTSPSKLRGVIARKAGDLPEIVEAVIDVLIWTGCIGVRSGRRTVYISDCGFKRPYIRSLILNKDDRSLVFHPTLASIFSTPATAPTRSGVSRRGRAHSFDERQGKLPV